MSLRDLGVAIALEAIATVDGCSMHDPDGCSGCRKNQWLPWLLGQDNWGNKQRYRTGVKLITATKNVPYVDWLRENLTPMSG